MEPTASLTVLKKRFRRIESVSLTVPFGAVIDAASPARLISTRMSTLASVESTEDGWRLVLSGIGLESEAYE